MEAPRCPSVELTLQQCMTKFSTACSRDDSAGTCKGDLSRCVASLDRIRGGETPSDVSWRKIVEQDLAKRFADIRGSQRCERFEYRLDAGELVLTGKLMGGGAKTARDRAAEIGRVLPSLRFRDDIEVVSECPLNVDGWTVVLGSGGVPRAMRWGELPQELQRLGEGLPSERECEALGTKLEQQQLMRADGTTGIWARDSDGITGLCQKQGSRWVINPTGYDRFPGLVLRKGN